MGGKRALMMSIGAVFGGPEQHGSPIERTLVGVMNLVADGRPPLDDHDGGRLNFVFIVEGSLVKPDFEGARTAKFSRKWRLLMIQIAVPKSLHDSPALLELLFYQMRDGVELATEFFAKKRIPFDREKFRRFIDEIEWQMRGEGPVADPAEYNGP